MIGKMTIYKVMIMAGTLAMASAVTANTGTVTAALDGGTFNVAFANHAHETNSLWVVYGPGDSGTGTNGWAHVERLGTVTPETNAWTYPAPAGWGETVKAIRFILSEVPYDYDYSLDFIRSKSKERLVLDDFDLYLNYRICMQCNAYYLASNNGSFFTNRGGVSAKPYFTLFAIGGTNWRFDYNGSNGTGISGVTTNVPYDIAASSAGLYVNNVGIASLNGSASTAQSQGRLEFFWGGTSATSGQNNGHHISFYGAQIYDAPTGGNLLVNLVPMVKDGRPGIYDTVRNVYYFSDTGTDFDLSYGPSRVEGANPFFAGALCKVVATGPEVFTPASPVTISESITNTYGGILDGTATLTLTGENDWGGAFTVSNGTLVAAFGQGLAATDCLRLDSPNQLSGTYGGYGGWNGRATATLGADPGQIYVPQDGYCYLAYCAADGGALEVDIGGEGAPWTPVGNYRRLLLNGADGAGTLRFKNPIALAGDHLIARVGDGTVIFDGNITNVNQEVTRCTMSCYGYDAASLDGVGIIRGTTNNFFNLNVYSGHWIIDENTTNTITGCLTTEANGRVHLFVSNATVRITGEDGNGGWLYAYGGTNVFAGGSLEAGGFIVGDSKNQKQSGSLTFSGKVRMEAIGSKSFGSGTINSSAASEALTIEEGADVEIYNLVFLRRNIYHKGGKLKLKGNHGILRMGEGGTARYHLFPDAELITPYVGQHSNSSGTYSNNGTAQFIFHGGTLTTRFGGNLFRDFNTNSAICVAARYGGVLCASNNVSITNGMVVSSSAYGTGTEAWNYAAANWLTAPAFKKTGTKTLTLSGTNTYLCATDVAEGTLKLESGELPGVLPTNGVVRLTGGTLDLGGNEQTVRALLGTAGGVTNGTLIAKDGIYPGGVGAVGAFACGATLEGTLHVDVDSEGACDKLVARDAADISRIDLVLPDNLPAGVEKLQIVEGATTGAFRSVKNLPQGWGVVAKDSGLWAQRVVGTTVIFR